MALKSFLSIFLWIAFIASPTIASAKTSNSTTISISIVIPERAEDQQCVIGFESSMDNRFTSMQGSGCRYDSKALLQTAYQQATKRDGQGFLTVVITAP